MIPIYGRPILACEKAKLQTPEIRALRAASVFR